MNEAFSKSRTPGEPLVNIPALRRVVMVGAVTDPDGNLSITDRSLLRYGLEPLRETGLPVVSDEEIEIEVMNKADIFGGRDFLAQEGVQADIVILCNIPHKLDHAEYQDIYGTMQRAFVISAEHLGHHELSSRHWDPGIWARKIKDTGAKVVISYGSDSMPLEEITPPGYFHSRQLKTMPSSGLYLMDSAFVVNLPFSQWVNSHPALNKYIVESQFSDMSFDDLTEPGHGREHS